MAKSLKQNEPKKPPTPAQIAARKAGGERLRALNANKRDDGPDERDNHTIDPRNDALDAREDQREGQGRRRRRPLGMTRHRLTGRVPEGMVGHWFNDSPGRIQDALDAGYHFIDGEAETSSREGARKERVGVNPDGSVLMAHLMAIPKEFYDEDQATKQTQLDEFDETIRRSGNLQGAEAQDGQNFYMPEQRASVRYGD